MVDSHTKMTIEFLVFDIEDITRRLNFLTDYHAEITSEVATFRESANRLKLALMEIRK